MKREMVLKTVNEFPKDVDLDQLFERLLFVKKVQEGIEQADQGKVIPHAKVVASFKRKWRK